jgi:putative phage-type endonuclease
MPKLTEAQLAARREGLGATDLVEALGLAPWESAGPMRLWLEKTGQEAREEPTEDKSAYLEWGHTQEKVLLDWYEESRRVTLLAGGHVPHREHPWLWATLDGKASDRIVEAKHVGPAMAHHWSESEEDGVPRYVRAQCLIGQACLGTRLTDVVASVGGRPPHVWTVAWDGGLVELLISGGRRFWDLVVRREAPKLDATDASLDWIKRKYPTNEDRIILEATPEAEDIAARRIMASVEEEDAKVKKRLADLDLLEKIGPHDGIRGDGWSMTHRVDKNGVRRQRFTAKGPR